MTRPRLAVAATALVLVLAAAMPAKAQTAAPAPAPPAASHLAAAREVALIAGIERTLNQLLPEFSSSIRQVTVTRPELAKDLDEVLNALKPELDQRKEEVIDVTTRAFASRMSEAELRDVVAFFKSPSGAKFAEVEPIVSNDVVTELGRWAQRMSEFTVSRVRTEMAKRGHTMQ